MSEQTEVPPYALTVIDDSRALTHPDAIHPVTAYLGSLGSPHSRRTMLGDLSRVAALLSGIDPRSMTADDRRALVYDVPWHLLTIAHTGAIRSKLIDLGYAFNTINRHLSSVRGVLRAAWEQDLMTNEAYRKAGNVKPVRGERLLSGRNMTDGEIAALMRVCAEDTTPAGARDAALFACLYVNLRRSEVIALDLADYDREKGEFLVHGKGDKQRAVPVGDARRALDDWLIVRGDAPGPLLYPVNKSGKLSVRRMSSQAVYNASQKRAQKAGIAHFSPHDFRRTYAGDLLNLGVDIVIVQRLMGHSSPITTSRYDRRPDEVKRQAVALRHLPYQTRKQPALPI
jgi:site-specific recombinase XerD